MDLETHAAALLGSAVTQVRPLGGGCIAEVARLDLADGRMIVAKRGSAGLALEGRMLSYLRDPGGLRVPGVFHASGELLLIEFIPSGGSLSPAAERDAARAIADLHEVSAPSFGFEYDTVIAGLPQPNGWMESWPDFFAEQRLLPMARLAYRRRRLPKESLALVERVAGRLNRLLAPGPASLLHGDLWGGNVLVTGEHRTAYIDPAIYYGHAEVELAFSTLFGTFGQAFFGLYQEIRPLEPGFFEERRDLYNLYPLLVHTVLFGGHYARSVRVIAQRFA